MSEKDRLKEIEIKLYANSQTMARLRDFSLFKAQSASEWQQKELLNQYFDTKEHALADASVALRIRKDGVQRIQTLKTKGQSIGGLSARNEFEWLVNSSELNLGLLDAESWPDSLAALDKTKLMAVFATDFVRELILVNWKTAKDSVQIEVALDRGFIKANNQQEAISELELELKEGSADAMLDFAIELAKQFPLVPSNISKSERGYRLSNPDRYQFSLKPKTESGIVLQQIQYYLDSSQRLLEDYLWHASEKTLHLWFEQLIQLDILFSSLSNKELLPLLTTIIDDWQTVIKAGDEFLLADKVRQEMDNTRWGVFSLSVSRWLLNQY